MHIFSNRLRKGEKEKNMKNIEKPGTLAAGLYVAGFIICGYFIIKAILTL